MKQTEYDVAVTFKLRVKAASVWEAAAICDDLRLKHPDTSETLVPHKTNARAVGSDTAYHFTGLGWRR